MLSLINVMRPKHCPVPLIRIGGNKDGGYLVPDDLQGVKACFSPGVNNRKDFEDELLSVYDIESHMCDYSSDLSMFKTPLNVPGQTFRKKWLDVDGSADSICLKEWVEELVPDSQDDLILQMDIEGAEYRNLLNTPGFILCRFRIILIELHCIKRACECQDFFRQQLGPLLSILDKYFICVHAHPNNCCGEFLLEGTNLNLPNVHELTFLRRDRLDGVAKGACYPPMLPHPLDIPSNMPNKPPIFLNEHWLASGKRSPESSIRMLSEQVDYLQRELKRERSLTKDIVNDLHKLSQYAASAIPDAPPNSVNDALCDLAFGKPYVLSSHIGKHQGNGLVTPKKPFFFHTRMGRNQYITIDLGIMSYLHELHIANRSDGFHERARCLFYCLHNDSLPDFYESFAVTINDDFTKKADYLSVTEVYRYTPRYVTIFSVENTMLHFSDIQIIGVSSKNFRC